MEAARPSIPAPVVANTISTAKVTRPMFQNVDDILGLMITI